MESKKHEGCVNFAVRSDESKKVGRLKNDRGLCGKGGKYEGPAWYLDYKVLKRTDTRKEADRRDLEKVASMEQKSPLTEPNERPTGSLRKKKRGNRPGERHTRTEGARRAETWFRNHTKAKACGRGGDAFETAEIKGKRKGKGQSIRGLALRSGRAPEEGNKPSSSNPRKHALKRLGARNRGKPFLGGSEGEAIAPCEEKGDRTLTKRHLAGFTGR